MTMTVKAYAHHTDSDPLFSFDLPDSMKGDWLTDAITGSNTNLWWAYEHKDCGCSRVVALDCCDETRWECETALSDDGEYKDGIRVCREGFGCSDPIRSTLIIEEAEFVERFPSTKPIFEAVGHYRNSPAGGAYWEDGPLTKALLEGHIIVADEINPMPQAVYDALHGNV